MKAETKEVWLGLCQQAAQLCGTALTHAEQLSPTWSCMFYLMQWYGLQLPQTRNEPYS